MVYLIDLMMLEYATACLLMSFTLFECFGCIWVFNLAPCL